MATKKCSKCNKILPINLFHKSKLQKSGLACSCKICKQLYYKVRGKSLKKIYTEKHKEQIKQKRKEKYQKNREKEIQRVSKYRKLNSDKVNEYNKKYIRKYKDNLKYKLSRSIRTKMVRSLKNGSKNRQRWEILVNYTFKQLKQHLEKQFKPGMSWDNYGKWHIDHIKPICSFNYKSPNDITFQQCWNLNNLQPLWAKENISKGGK
jgi:hypothetical protein